VFRAWKNLSTPSKALEHHSSEKDSPVEDVDRAGSAVAKALEAAATTPTSPNATDAREGDKLASLKESLEAAHGVGMLDDMPGLSVPNAEDSASTSEDPADSQMDTLTKLSANELLLILLILLLFLSNTVLCHLDMVWLKSIMRPGNGLQKLLSPLREC
jgi:hypothetical protein